MRRRHNNLNKFFLSQAQFDLPERNLRNTNNKTILFNPTSEVIKIFSESLVGTI